MTTTIANAVDRSSGLGCRARAIGVATLSVKNAIVTETTTISTNAMKGNDILGSPGIFSF